MRFVFEARKNYFTKYLIFLFIAIIVFYISLSFVFKLPLFSSTYFFVLPAIMFFLIFLINLPGKYILTEKGLIINLPLAKNFFPYSSIVSIEKISAKEIPVLAEKLVKKPKNSLSKFASLIDPVYNQKDIYYLLKYDNGGTSLNYSSFVNGKVFSPIHVTVFTDDDFILLKAKRNGNITAFFLLSPKNIEDFIKKAKIMLRK